MAESNDSLHLTDDQAFYIKTALDLLAPQYDAQQESEHASQCRMLSARITAYRGQRRQPTEEDAAQWQQRLVAASREPELFQKIIREWLHELTVTAIDPGAALSDALLSLSGDHMVTAQQTAMQILISVDRKLNGLIQDPNVPDPEAMFQQFMQFVHTGISRIHDGQPPWDDDPHLRAAAERMAAEQAHQASQGS